jgi:cytochrome P450
MNSDLPPHEKTPARVSQDARTLVGAGSETTATTLEITTFYLLSHPELKKQLKQELAPVAQAGNLTDYEVLKRLPYLSAVGKEGLRRAS